MTRWPAARRVLSENWLPVTVWALAALCVAAVAAANGFHPFKSSTWERWDSVLYEDVAVHGYTLMPCSEQLGGASKWCGNAGWFPLYPWLIGSLHRLRLPLRETAVVVSWLFTGGTLVLLWRTFLDRSRSAAAIGALLYAAFAPGQVYDYAIFPLSMLAFFTVAHLWALWRDRFVVAGLTGTAAALSYPIGVMLVPISALWLLTDRKVPWVTRAKRVALASGLPVAGLALFVAVQRVQTGRWNAYFLVHQKYDHGFRNPFSTFWGGMQPLFEGWIQYLEGTPTVLTIFVAAVLVAVLVTMAVRRPSWTRLHLLLVIWALITWAFPLTQANLSLARSQAALLPLAVLVRDLPRPLLFALVLGAAALSVPMTAAFLQAKVI